jgi:hypothetical protein
MWFITPGDRVRELREKAGYTHSSSDWLLLGLAMDRVTAYAFVLTMGVSFALNWPPSLLPDLTATGVTY